MAITKITDPSALPTATSDYEAQNNHINNHTLNLTPPYPVSGGSVLKGAIFNIGGDLFYTDSDTSITGTSSDYVMITASGSTATASYVTSLTTLSVAWNQAYNGYYDGSGRLFIFNELEAAYKNLLSIKSNNAKMINDFIDVIYTNVFAKLFAAFGSTTRGLTVDSSTGNLISGDANGNFIYIHNGISSSVLSSFSTPATDITGLAYDSSTGNLISCDNITNLIYIHNGISATTTSSFATPASDISGITYDPSTGNLISCDRTTDLVYVHDGVTSTVLDSFSIDNPQGLTIDIATGNLITCSSQYIRIYNGISSSILYTEIARESTGASINGLAYNAQLSQLISIDLTDDLIAVHEPILRKKII